MSQERIQEVHDLSQEIIQDNYVTRNRKNSSARNSVLEKDDSNSFDKKFHFWRKVLQLRWMAGATRLWVWQFKTWLYCIVTHLAFLNTSAPEAVVRANQPEKRPSIASSFGQRPARSTTKRRLQQTTVWSHQTALLKWYTHRMNENHACLNLYKG